jgi:hypothetical protein
MHVSRRCVPYDDQKRTVTETAALCTPGSARMRDSIIRADNRLRRSLWITRLSPLAARYPSILYCESEAVE